MKNPSSRHPGIPAWLAGAVTLLSLMLAMSKLCAAEGLPALRANMPRQVILDRVPQLYQQKNECGPTCIAMVPQFWGISTSLENLKNDLNWDPDKGTRPAQMQQFPARLGLRGHLYSGDLEKLMENLAQGRPVIVRQWKNEETKEEAEMGHYRVAIGYDFDGRIIFLRDPNRSSGSSSLQFEDFLSLWDMGEHSTPSHNWMLVVYK